ncbi:hypothetical protein B1219_07485 [Pseudomonas ogarae]|uniref:DUF1826 domain-containing protein n=1 Tax=Pseudomonas ogarae (strain DSM 112162 / CECT 30235 / F113) TaxID=1114970 RepID=UPI0009A458C0|nr:MULTISPECIES: DUF1826 domain-containing protein [Pseudomonas]OPG73166.1 hypothetical protein B1219_07485 [Pseudomonas ogarae]OPG76109.1 hypothetical protein B1218_27845 [Pseudomonas ogarae]PBJ04108.1 hypothetical protein BSF43_43910 [Pseudomonas ogarae]PBJ24981.1 hypothetical protein BSG18_11510 [Pseudomonas ogarae]QXH94941.1 DUF1826 domain-containing protein [Pseudomonas zarinae]
MLAPSLKRAVPVRQAQGDTPGVFTQILDDGTNLAVWQRQLPAHISDFAAMVLAMDQSLAESRVLELPEEDTQPALQGLAAGFSDLQGYEGFIADVSWLVSAFACLLGAQRVGLRLRTLDKAMCPRFHVDHVPVRLLTTYAGVGSQWLEEGAMDRRRLAEPEAEPSDPRVIQQFRCGDVGLLKGEKWQGNEGLGLIHRSPDLAPGERRLILTLDWLA